MLNAISGFTLLNDGGYDRDRRLGKIIAINCGYETDYSLLVTVERSGGENVIRFDVPLAYRVQEERDLLHYWSVREREAVAIGVLYTVDHSPYRSEFISTVSAQEYSFQHYLVAGDDLCVEVLTARPPQLPKDW